MPNKSIQSSENEPSDASAGVSLRLRLLRGTPEEFGIVDPGAVWAVAMDMPVGDEIATVTALADGNASLYTTGTFGIIGGFAHDHVRAAAIRLCATAERFLGQTTPSNDVPYPAPDRILFYVLTPNGVRSVDADKAVVTGGKHALTALFFAANDVLSELRLVVEAADDAG